MSVTVAWDSASDVDLVCALPDPGALEELFVRYRLMILAYGARRCGRPEDVADLLAATFLAVLEGAHRFDPRRGEVRPWLFGIARRQLGLVIRKQYRDRALLDKIGVDWDRHSDDMTRIEEQIDASRAVPRVEQALAGLPDAHREALWLVGHDGLTPSDAAQAIGVHPGAFRVRLLRARRALQAALDDPDRTPLPPLIRDSNPMETQ
jgi:RNA polymerase sigma-70 factor (ECF subfamily)